MRWRAVHAHSWRRARRGTGGRSRRRAAPELFVELARALGNSTEPQKLATWRSCLLGNTRERRTGATHTKDTYTSILHSNFHSAARALLRRPLGYHNTSPHTKFGRAAVTWTASWTVHALRFRVGRGRGLPAGGCLRAEQGLARRRRTLRPGSAGGRQGLPPGAASRPASLRLRRRQPLPRPGMIILGHAE